MSTAGSTRRAQSLQRVWSTRGVLAHALWPLAWLFGVVTRCRRALFASGVLRRERIDVPVVIVGNLIVGGAGKTPVVIAVVAALHRHGRTPGIVARGYGRDSHALLEVTRGSAAAEAGDEPLLLHLRTGAPVVVGADRVAAARRLRAAHPEVDVIVGDDGLQHLRLCRDLEILVFDERGAGNGWLLPAGPLREPMPVRLPLRALVVYNANLATTPLSGTIATRRLCGAVALADWWRGVPASAAVLDALRHRPLLAAAGVARPLRFFGMLRDRGLQIVPLALPDHHDFAVLPWPPDTADVVVTEKDAIKLLPARCGTTRVWVAPLDFGLDADFDAAVNAAVDAAITP